MPPISALTPSEIVLLAGDKFAPLLCKSDESHGLLGRIKAEARFAAWKCVPIAIGLGLLAISPQSGEDLSAAIVSGVVGAILVLGGIAYLAWQRLRARPGMFLPSGATPLLDDGRAADTRGLATTLLAAAFLANARAGVIDLEEGADGVVAVPTGTTGNWPRATLEARVIPEHAGPVRAIVGQWLAAESLDPFARAVTMTKICAVVRGFAQIRQIAWNDAYLLEPGAANAYAALKNDSIRSLLDECRTTRPALWSALCDAIESGFLDQLHVIDQSRRDERGIPDDKFTEPSPWELEAKVDREAAHDPSAEAPEWVGYVLLLVIDIAAVYTAYQLAAHFDRVRLAAIVGTVTVGAILLGGRKPPTPEPGQPVMKLASLPLRIEFALFLATIVAGAAVALTSAEMKVRFAVGAMVAALVFIIWRKYAEAKIQARRRQFDAPAKAASVPAPAAERGQQAGVASPIALELHDADSLPVPPDEVWAQLNVNALRSDPLRRIWRNGLLMFVGGYIALSVIFWLMDPDGPYAAIADGVTLSKRIPLLPLTWASCCIVAIGLLYKLDKWSDGSLAAAEKNELQPWRLICFTAAWVAFALVRIPFQFEPSSRLVEISFSLLALAFVIGHLGWMRRTLTTLERQFPLQAPKRLLVLRLPSSMDFGELNCLIAPWRRVGVTVVLDAPGSGGVTMSDMIKVAFGHFDDVFVKDMVELDRALASLSLHPDRNLEYGHSVTRCTPETWQPAVGRALPGADVVLLDLTGLSREKPDGAYELGRLLDEVPLARVILLVDNSTDMILLEQLLDDAWQSIAPGSPNLPGAGLAWRLLRVGGAMEQGADESASEWTKRLEHRLTDMQLTAVTFQSAQIPRPVSADQLAASKQASSTRWAVAPLPGRLQLASNIALGVLFGFSVISLGLHQSLVTALNYVANESPWITALLNKTIQF